MKDMRPDLDYGIIMESSSLTHNLAERTKIFGNNLVFRKILIESLVLLAVPGRIYRERQIQSMSLQFPNPERMS